MLKSYIQLTFLIIIISLSSCHNNDRNTKQLNKHTDTIPSAINAIKAHGDTLIALTHKANASYFIYKGHTQGYEYEMLNKLAEHLHLHLEIKLVDEIDSLVNYLNQGKGDLIAYPLRVTNEQRNKVNFTERLFDSPQCLIQRKPIGWKNMLPHQIDNKLIRNVLDIKQKEIFVKQNSTQETRLENLGQEIGDSLNIIPISGIKSDFDLMEMVAEGNIEYTIADEEIASMYAAYNDDIDYATPLSMPQEKAWALRKNSPQLLTEINLWIRHYKRYKEYYFIYDKYYNNPATLKKIRYNYYSSQKGNLSTYDDLLKQESQTINWDWRLLASQMYQESRFKNNLESSMGALGLMQVLPNTAAMHGFINLTDPQTNIRTAIAHLQYIEKQFADIDSLNRIKFTLAAYNVGCGHVFDAQRLATHLGLNPLIWDDNVAEALLLKSQKKYYQLPECRNGYCRGSEPYKYVYEILDRYEHYKALLQ